MQKPVRKKKLAFEISFQHGIFWLFAIQLITELPLIFLIFTGKVFFRTKKIFNNVLRLTLKKIKKNSFAYK